MSEVPLEFRDLVSTDDLQGEVVDADRSVSKVIPASEPLHPVEEFFAKAETARFNIPTITAPTKHPDGVEIEKTTGGEYHYTYKNNFLTKSEVVYESGRRELIEETPVPDLIIKTELAKILGLRVEDQIEQEVGG